MWRGGTIPNTHANHRSNPGGLPEGAGGEEGGGGAGGLHCRLGVRGAITCHEVPRGPCRPPRPSAPRLDVVVVRIYEATRLVLPGGVGPRGVPLDSLGGGARHGGAAGHGGLDAVAVVVVGEVAVEDRAEVAPLLRAGPEGSKAGKSAALEAARSSTRGGGWAPNGPASHLGELSQPELSGAP